MVYKVFIQPSHNLSVDIPTVQISDYLLERLNIPQKDMIAIKLGGELIIANRKRINFPTSEETIFFNQKCYSCANLPCISIKLQAMNHQNCLVLGPVIAVMTEIKLSNEKTPIFPSMQGFCEELHEYCSHHGGLVFVTNLSRFPSSGFFFRGWWVEDLVPKPNIIYNRIHSRQIEENHQFQLLKNKWEKDGMILFNANYLSKWQVHEIMFKNTHLQSFLPATSLFDETTLDQWILQYKDLYIKPNTGSMGRRIIHYFIKDNHFHIEQTSLSKKMNDSFRSLQKASEQIKKWIKGKPFIIQETIPLIEIDNKKIDFRFLCHKNSEQTWSITSSVARISREKHFVSNIAQGGSILRPENILQTFFEKEKIAEIVSLMRELALQAARVISNENEGLLGELGIDIGVDFNGKPWLIEVNSKPSKRREDDGPNIRPSTKAIFHFCTILWIERSKCNDQTWNINDDAF